MKLLIACLLLATAAVYSYALPSAREFLSFVPAQDQQKIFAQGELVEFGDTLNDLHLWKNSPFAEEVRSATKDFDSSLVAECIFLIDRPVVANDQELEQKILKSFTAFSTMKGLQAFSASQQKMEPFIYDSYQVDSVQNHRAMPDPDPRSISGPVHYVVYAKEEQTGDMFNEFVLIPHGTWYEVRLENLSDIKYGPFTLVGAHQLKTSYYVFPASDKIVVYGINVANTLRFLGLEKTKRASFANRMRAIESWFAAGLAGKPLS